MARVAIVTGGTRGIGEAISLALRDKGVIVAANYAGNDDRAKAFTEKTGIKTPATRASNWSRPNWARSTSSSTMPASPATAPCSR
jgi:NAD(P)-dependent dehydrogenase (short-subunit alcohol dehydrogenase family)